jgi:hypothetical protein
MVTKYSCRKWHMRGMMGIDHDHCFPLLFSPIFPKKIWPEKDNLYRQIPRMRRLPLRGGRGS